MGTAMLTRSITLRSGLVLLGIGAAIAVAWFHDDNVQRVGLFAMMIGSTLSLACAMTRNINDVNRPADQAYELGYDMGYDKGFREGRKAQRITVVPIRSEQVTAQKL
jgi:hypothetical protein